MKRLHLNLNKSFCLFLLPLILSLCTLNWVWFHLIPSHHIPESFLFSGLISTYSISSYSIAGPVLPCFLGKSTTGPSNPSLSYQWFLEGKHLLPWLLAISCPIQAWRKLAFFPEREHCTLMVILVLIRALLFSPPLQIYFPVRTDVQCPQAAPKNLQCLLPVHWDAFSHMIPELSGQLLVLMASKLWIWQLIGCPWGDICAAWSFR